MVPSEMSSLLSNESTGEVSSNAGMALALAAVASHAADKSVARMLSG